MVKKIFLFLVFSKAVYSSTFFLPDSDTAALVALVSNTASTLAHTLQILEVAKETAQKMDEYNQLAMRRLFIARRIEQHTRDILNMKKLKPKSLKEVNAILRKLKSNMQNLRSNIDLAANNIWEVENFTNKHWSKIVSASHDEKETHIQEIASAGEGASKKHIQNTAMNTAMMGKIMSKMRRDNLEYQKIDLELKQTASIRQLRREQFYNKWIGLND